MSRLIHSFLMAGALSLAACGSKEAPKPEPKIETPKEEPEDLGSLVSVKKLTDGVWIHTSSKALPGAGVLPSNGLAVADGDGLILVDTAWGELATQELAKKLKKETGKDITKVVITHFHYDRLAGVDWLEDQGATVYTHPDTPGLSLPLGTPVPNTTVPELSEIGARTNIGPIEISFPGPAHTSDNLMVWVKEPKLLFGGCAVRADHHKSLGNLAHADLSNWGKSIAWAKTTYGDARMVVPSHGNPAGAELLVHTMALVEKTVKETKD